MSDKELGSNIKYWAAKPDGSVLYIEQGNVTVYQSFHGEKTKATIDAMSFLVFDYVFFCEATSDNIYSIEKLYKEYFG